MTDTTQTPSLESRYLGALLGLATGDAVGTTLEFARPGSFEPITDMVGGGPFNLRPGEWTDDTSMALCLAESIIETGGFDAEDQMQRYLRWRDEGHLSATGHCFDIGVTTTNALNRYKRWRTPYVGSTNPNSAGNGSLMRLAPIPMRWRKDLNQTALYAALSSRTTHAAEEAVDACRYYAVLISRALNGMPKEAILNEPVTDLETFKDQPLAPAIAAIADGSYRRKRRRGIRGSGYVVHTLEAALWALDSTDDFRSGLLKVVNLGEDADTTGAVYGQLAGAIYAVENIPTGWRELLAMGSLLKRFAFTLLRSTDADSF